MINIVIVDDELLFLKGIRELLEQEEEFNITHQYTDPQKLLREWDELPYRPDILLTDVKMPAVNGIELTKLIHDKSPTVKVIGLSSYYSKVLIFQMLKLGAAAYLPKNVTLDRLIRTIKNVYEQGFYFEDIVLKAFHEKTLSPKAEKEILNHGLTNREVEVMLLICEQHTNQEIADKLFISLKTVERHRSNLFEKTNSRNVVGIVMFALKNKLIEQTFM